MAARASVLVVGAGLAGAACARALHERGLSVEVVERGRAPGGRMASPELAARRVDLGAAYLTAADTAFLQRISTWRTAGLVHAWTDRFDAIEAGGRSRVSAGPLRWATTGGMRSLVRAELDGIRVRLSSPVSTVALDRAPRVDGERYDAVVLAMPDPQARALLDRGLGGLAARLGIEYQPVLALAAGFSERSWPFQDGCFVNGHPDAAFIADDGARRGDGAPVLVLHSTTEFAARHLDAPEQARMPLLAALKSLTGVTAEPLWTKVHRWRLAKPTTARSESYLWDERGLGVAGDSWCPQGAPRVEAAWLSGRALGRRIADELG